MYKVIILVAIVFIWVNLGSDAVKKSVNSQDTMLCNSALTSGNSEYLKKCDCYYKGNDIACIQK